MENIELYFLRSFETEIAKEILPIAARLDDEGKTLQDTPQLERYIEHYGIYKTDIGVYALVNNKLAGAAWVRVLKGENNRGFGYVNDQTPELVLGVKPEFRNQGVGTKIMEQLMREVAMSFDQMSLCVRKNNPAIKLYERLGFTKIEGSQRHDEKRDIDTFIMLATLEKADQNTQEEDWYQATQKWRNDIY
jgi:ribosomal protein S18 acetylase RimI-like enzyme